MSKVGKISVGEQSGIGQRCKNYYKKWEIFLLSFLTFLSFVLFSIFWRSNILSSIITSKLALKNCTLSFQWWQVPEVKAVYRIRVFNYTNVNEFQSGKDEKLKVQEVGPYIYKEILTRVNAVFHDNGTITYQEKRSFKWEGGNPAKEMITVPSVPLFAAVSFMRDMNYIAQLALTTFFSSLQVKTFVTLPANDFLWGYDDKLFMASKIPMALQRINLPYEKFGLMAFKNGLSKDRITIDTGSKDIKNLGMITRINGKEFRNVWHDKKCDKIEGTDGTMFPPHLLRDPNATLKVYAKELCRTIPLKFHGESTAQGFSTLRYTLDHDLLELRPGSCFCKKTAKVNGKSTKVCPPKGLFNTSSCNFNVPLLSSYPHFLTADKSVLEHVEGLKPNKDLHDSYVDLHPRLGVPVGGWSRIQINLEARKAEAVPFFGRIKDGSILPLAWIEMGIGDIPDNVYDVLYLSQYTVNAIESCLRWASLFCVILSLAALYQYLMKHRSKKHRMLRRNISGQNPLIKADDI